MNRHLIRLFPVLIIVSTWILLTSGCVRRPPVATPYPHPGPQQAGGQKEKSAESVRQPISENPLATSIRKQARQLAGQGRPEAAAQVLERGLRIAPRDGWLWLDLAAIRLGQGRTDQAAILARKARSLARNDPALRHRAGQIIRSTE